jgi:fibro-slime domain-containing protein
MYVRQLLYVGLAASLLPACAPSESPDDDAGSEDASSRLDGGAGDAGPSADARVTDAARDAARIDGGLLVLCGNAQKESSEQCDDGNVEAGDGCSDSCTLEPGYECKVPGQRCALNVVCGDGQMGPREVCDDANAEGGDGCSADCRSIETDFSCATPGAPCTSNVVCGDKHLVGSELCDDGNLSAGDGCSATCSLELGYACRVVGASCRAASCGDGLRVGTEECDDGNKLNSDGCDDHCRVVSGFVCTLGMPSADTCRATSCGDGLTEGSEQCDDGPNDKPYDGCYKCQREPVCTNQGCASVCGDGIKFADEACDDGNTRSGDGCSSSCAKEAGFTCSTTVSSTPNTIDIPIILRDLRGNDLPAIPDKAILPGHTDFQNQNKGLELGLVKDTLNADKKPVFNKAGLSFSIPANFVTWYKDAPGVNISVVDKLTFTKKADGSYDYDNTAFFPLDNRGFMAPAVAAEAGRDGGHNFSFTSELRYWFEYKGGEKLDFRGDDDVWVFINGKLAVDIGGVHGQLSGSVTLAPTMDARFGIVTGKIYEVVVFQAERHTTQSNYKLTLKGFEKVRSTCESKCGDGVVTSDEICDDGVNQGDYGECMPGCQNFGPRCGDGAVQTEAGEQCDLGINVGGYNRCTPECKSGPRCGDGKVDGMFGEACDDEVNDGGYGECAPSCVLGERCGDGARQAGESCDDGNDVASDGCDNACESIILI